jgi:hypothetical protein
MGLVYIGTQQVQFEIEYIEKSIKTGLVIQPSSYVEFPITT